MLNLEWIRKERNRGPVLLANAAIILAIASGEWWTKNRFSLGLFYLFPIMLVAGFLPRWAVVLEGACCALLSWHFTNLDPMHGRIQFGVGSVALTGCGLFVAEAFGRARLSEVQQRICALVETGATAMVIVDARGMIETANRAAVKLLAPRNGRLIGQPIGGCLPALHQALRSARVREFRTAMECPGQSGNGKSFLAHVWLSTYKHDTTLKMAAIMMDVTARPAAS
jgi:hypothetical protein